PGVFQIDNNSKKLWYSVSPVRIQERKNIERRDRPHSWQAVPSKELEFNRADKAICRLQQVPGKVMWSAG
ncbi:MAG: hypothetical protein R3330_11985, partial [Saprospiraceae bacterium]|nr:hypothetical protein [Saprospiraceae bacterium]